MSKTHNLNQMEQFLKDYLLIEKKINPEYYHFKYSEDVNNDALSEDWLENRTSYIYKVGVLAAIDSNKCDFVHVAIASMRGENSMSEIKGYFHFDKGENDDMGRTIERAFKLLQYMHPAF